MADQNNNLGYLNMNDGDIGFVWESVLANPVNLSAGGAGGEGGSSCPTPTSDLKAAVETGEGSGAAPAKKKKKQRVDGEHIFTERERRKKMRVMFDELQEMLPHLPAKVDKSTIVDEAVNYIKTLEQKYQSLQRQKLERYHGRAPTPDPLKPVESPISREAFIADQGSAADYQILAAGNPLSGAARFATTYKTWSTPNMVLNVCGDWAQINICCPKKAGIGSVVAYYLEKYKIQLLYGTISCDFYRCMFTIQARATGGVDQLSEAALSMEETFQLAMGEMMLHISNMQ